MMFQAIQWEGADNQVASFIVVLFLVPYYVMHYLAFYRINFRQLTARLTNQYQCTCNPDLLIQVFHLFNLYFVIVELVLRGYPMGHKNMAFQDRWSLWDVQLHWNVGPWAKNIWCFKTGGLSWQWSLKTGLLYMYQCCCPIHIWVKHVIGQILVLILLVHVVVLCK